MPNPVWNKEKKCWEEVPRPPKPVAPKPIGAPYSKPGFALAILLKEKFALKLLAKAEGDFYLAIKRMADAPDHWKFTDLSGVEESLGLEWKLIIPKEGSRQGIEYEINFKKSGIKIGISTMASRIITVTVGKHRLADLLLIKEFIMQLRDWRIHLAKSDLNAYALILNEIILYEHIAALDEMLLKKNKAEDKYVEALAKIAESRAAISTIAPF